MSKRSVVNEVCLDDGSIQLVLLGVPSSEIKERVAKRNYAELVLDAGDWSDLSFIENDLKKVKYLVVRTTQCDWELISKLSNLETLIIGDVNYNSLGFSHFKKLKRLSLPWSKRIANNDISVPNLEILEVDKWGGEDLTALSNFPSLKKLSLIESYKLSSCNGLEDLNLTSLEIFSARKLSDLSAISNLHELRSFELASCNAVKNISDILKSNNLKFLNIETCKNINDIQELGNENLKELRYLGLFCIPEIQSLNFLKGFKSLDALMLGDTKVIDGNLGMLLDIKTLRLVEGKNKKHYHPPLKEIQDVLEKKWGDKYTWDIQPWKD